ncbi:hypothetical protein HYPSUDRAFT_38419 [Hypholoma sublateritium FD-334 SS-4]|uniref:Uncharacterized protein n=1 Tax=Hypholoma sublateritium (strain FD-334 SS-4) TaxID=945553 RepID=A0A0D2PZJ6_HYPSF|nr:hypothetical protein HYPSUDRAFT_38419 [Hypholoma sublateritium FD-334 SS-4]
MFPSLKTVILYPPSYHSRNISCSVFKDAEEFILLRLRIGHPITTLDVSNCSPFDDPPNLGALAYVKGLKVLYKRSSMIGIF